MACLSANNHSDDDSNSNKNNKNSTTNNNNKIKNAYINNNNSKTLMTKTNLETNSCVFSLLLRSEELGVLVTWVPDVVIVINVGFV